MLHRAPANDRAPPASLSSDTSLEGSSTFPESGIEIPDVGSPADLDMLATRIGPDTLPAGSSVFFEAVLRSWIPARDRPAVAPSYQFPLVAVSGTTAPATRATLAGLPADRRPPVFDVVADAGAVAQALEARGTAILLPPIEHGNAEAIREVLATLVGQLHARRAFRHLVVEGGSTAAAITAKLGWSVLDVLGQHAPGVITLRPRAASSDLMLTLKPGSYPWPGDWWEAMTLGPARTPPLREADPKR
jgi:uncharacterized protein YgbK (DUF1537 family)